MSDLPPPETCFSPGLFFQVGKIVSRCQPFFCSPVFSWSVSFRSVQLCGTKRQEQQGHRRLGCGAAATQPGKILRKLCACAC